MIRDNGTIEFDISEIDLLAAELTSKIPIGSRVGLVGALGAGKTTLIRSMVKALGGKEEQVSSPSYVLQHLYELPQGKNIEHWDLFRLNSVPQEIFDDQSEGTIQFIEWVDKFPSLLGEMEMILEISIPSVQCDISAQPKKNQISTMRKIKLSNRTV